MDTPHLHHTSVEALGDLRRYVAYIAQPEHRADGTHDISAGSFMRPSANGITVEAYSTDFLRAIAEELIAAADEFDAEEAEA